MPRRRYQRGGGGGGCCGCCGCCTYWNQDEEEVAQQAIKEKATSSIFGKVICCDCDRGYGRHTVKCGYILAGILCGLLFIITLSYSSGVYQPAVYMEKFEKAECTVNLIVWDRNTTDDCRWETTGTNNRVRHQEYYYDSYGRRRTRTYYTNNNNNRREVGWRTYRCLQIYVDYHPVAVVDRNETFKSALLVDGYNHLQSKSDKFSTSCTTRPDGCTKSGDLEEVARNMERHYRTRIRDKPFKCIYNPENLEEVTLPSDHNLATAYRNLVLFALALTLILILLVFMCCTCGCQYVCASRVPEEITMEVNKRRAENQGLTAADPAAPPGGNVIYVGQPMQMVPAQTGGGQPPMAAGPQPVPMQPMAPGQPPVGPQYGQYPPPGMQAPPPQGYYPGAQQPGYPAPQPAYPAPQPQYLPPGQYPPPQQGAYPPPHQGAYTPPQPGTYPPPGQVPPPGYAPGAPPPPAAGPPPASAPVPIPAGPPPPAAYEPPAYAGLNKEAEPLPEKPAM